MASHLAEDPEFDMTEDLYWLHILDGTVVNGAILSNPWYASRKIGEAKETDEAQKEPDEAETSCQDKGK